ncbi:MAG: aminotransferase class V-fold PLP-dependent enzyme, partial [Planctomycetales bacterium]
MPYEQLPDIYLDANATTRVLPKAAEAAQDAMEELFGNPSSSHITGLRARHLLESARTLARTVLGATSGRIVFTSGATEAIQMSVLSTLCHAREQRREGVHASDSRRLLLYGATEHKAVPQALIHWNNLLEVADEILEIPVDRMGKLDLGFLREHAAAADMVCTMAVNNETGVIHDLAAIEETLRANNESVSWMVDSVQAVGKINMKLSESTIDYATVSGHKLYAPKGVGILYVREGAAMTPLIAGGGQEGGARSGTENLPGVAALATVLDCLVDPQDTTFADLETIAGYRDRLVKSLSVAFPTIVFNTPFDSSVPTTINYSVKGCTSKEILDLFDAAGIRVSSGSACGSALRGSYVLDAMGMPQWQSEGAIRISFGMLISENQIATACQRIEEAGQALRQSCLILADNEPLTSSWELDGMIQLKRGSMCSWIYVDSATEQCIIVDPFEELTERIENLLRCRRLKVLAILDTHHHVDHESSRQRLLDALADHLASGALTSDSLGWPDRADGQVLLDDESEAAFIRLSPQEILVRTELPGHTTDSRAYLVSGSAQDDRVCCSDVRFAFIGDALQIGGLGRTDFPSSSVTALYDSLRRLPGIVADETVLCPTHDYINGFGTTLGAERQNNRFLASVLDPIAPISVDEFVRQKQCIDAEIDDNKNCELICGLIEPGASESSVDLSPEELKD